MVSWLLCLCGLVYGCASLIVFFFKQKTAYEMRISDWSSDVCSSDLRQPLRQCARAGGDEEAREGVEAVMSRPDSRDDRQAPAGRGTGRQTERGLRSGDYRGARGGGPARLGHYIFGAQRVAEAGVAPHPARSDARRVGEECGSTCSSRWSPFP